jgi:hypothetical protein
VGSLVATLLDDHAWEPRQKPGERERGCKTKRRGPGAVQVARTVPTGGMERRVLAYRAPSLPTQAAVCKLPSLDSPLRPSLLNGGDRTAGYEHA